MEKRKNSKAPFTFAQATSAHQEHPERNEDYLLVDRRNGLAVICDGVGTAIGADQAARIAARTVRTSWQRLRAQFASLSSTTTAFYLEGALQQLLDEANQAVLALGKGQAEEQKQRVESGQKQYAAETTIALALFYQCADGYLMGYAHIGDSRIYLLRENAALQRLTVDDGYFLWVMNKGELAEKDARRIDQASFADQLSEKEREHFERRNGITQSLGNASIALHVGQIALRPGDRILLCSDGIHDNLTDAEIEKILREGARTMVAKTLVRQSIARSLQEKTINIRAKKDDMSAIVVSYHPSPSPEQLARTGTS